MIVTRAYIFFIAVRICLMASLLSAEASAATAIWDGGGSTFLASDPTNWEADVIPESGSMVELGDGSSKDLVWDLTIPLQSWRQKSSYHGTVTLRTGYDGPPLKIAGDCIIEGGVLTHPANSGIAVWRLAMQVGGNFLLASGAAIQVTGLGYVHGLGALGGTEGMAGSHGGLGGSPSLIRPWDTYGSWQEPTMLGAAGWESGGGAVYLTIGGSARIDGVVIANGAGWYGQPCGAGGSVWIAAASQISGQGSVLAEGGEPWEWGTGGGGGRICLESKETSTPVIFSGRLSAAGGLEVTGRGGGPGTIALVSGRNSTLIIDNGWRKTHSRGICAVPQGQHWAPSELTLRSLGVLAVPPSALLQLPSAIVSDPGIGDGICVAGGKIAYSGNLGIDAWSLIIDGEATLPGDVEVSKNGVITHSSNNGVWGQPLAGVPADGGPLFGMDLTITGNLKVQQGGSVQADGRGYGRNQGPCTVLAGTRGGGSHGGIGATMDGAPAVNAQTYGDPIRPASMGSGGGWLSGGGVIKLVVGGTAMIDGRVSADGDAWYGNDGGAGGSVWMVAGRLTGIGRISANGGGPSNGEWGISGGGGRVAVYLTREASALRDFDGHITATTRAGWYQGSAGTVYIVEPRGPVEGTLHVDGRDLLSAQATNLDLSGQSVGDLEIKNGSIVVVCSGESAGDPGRVDRDLVVARGSALVWRGPVSVGRDLIADGSMCVVEGGVLNVGRDLIAAGGLDAGGAVATFTGGVHRMGGSATVGELTVVTSSATAPRIMFQDNAHVTVVDLLQMQGVSGRPLNLSPELTEGKWFIESIGRTKCEYIALKNSFNLGRDVLDAGPGSEDLGGNYRWDFNHGKDLLVVELLRASLIPGQAGVIDLQAVAGPAVPGDVTWHWSGQGPGLLQFSATGTASAAAISATAVSPGRYLITVRAHASDGQVASRATIIDIPDAHIDPDQANNVGTGLTGLYYAPEGDLFQSDWGMPMAATLDPAVNFTWHDGPIGPLDRRDAVAVRWLGFLKTDHGGSTKLAIDCDDAARLWIDGVLVIDSWTAGRLGNPDAACATVQLKPGKMHDVRMEYCEVAGNAHARLLWAFEGSQPTVIPTGNLYPAVVSRGEQASALGGGWQSAGLRLVAESFVSPACREGVIAPGTRPLLTADGKVIMTKPLSMHRFMVDVPLRENGPTDVVLSVGDVAQRSSIRWTPLPVSELNGQITVRVGDAVLLQPVVTGTLRILEGSGIYENGIPGELGSTVRYTFTKPGVFLVQSLADDGGAIGELHVRVLAVDWDGPIACQVGYMRTKDLGLAGGQASDVLVAPGDSQLLETDHRGAIAGGMRCGLRPLQVVPSVIVARAAADPDLILATAVIDPFILATSARRYVETLARMPDGSTLSEATIRMEPLVPGLLVSVHIFMGGVTFDDGTVDMAMRTERFIPEGSAGIWPYRLLRAPSMTAGLCHTLAAYQRGVQVSR